MILEIRVYKTHSGKCENRGRNDSIRLLAQTEAEKKWLEDRQKAKLPVAHRGSGYWWRALEDLREAARATDPHFKEDRKEFTL